MECVLAVYQFQHSVFGVMMGMAWFKAISSTENQLWTAGDESFFYGWVLLVGWFVYFKYESFQELVCGQQL